MNTTRDLQPVIDAQVADLVRTVADTRALYRSVCELLFFAHGITPTTNRLYSMVRRGSLGTVSEVLQSFWAELRSKARPEVQHLNLPEPIKETAALAITAIWEQSLTAARAELQHHRAEAAAKVDEARAAAERDRALAEEAARRLEIAEASAEAELARRAQLEQLLEGERQAHESTRRQLLSAQASAQDAQLRCEAAKSDLIVAISEHQAAMQKSAERSQAAERRLLLDTDRERQARLRAEQAAAHCQQQINTQSDLHKAELGTFRQAAAAAEAAAIQLRADLVHAQRDAASLQKQLDGARSSLDAAQRAATSFEAEATTLRGIIAKLQPASASRPSNPRKAGS